MLQTALTKDLRPSASAAVAEDEERIEHVNNLKMFTPRVGTHIYRAPEILSRGQIYNESIDLWSAGCCIYFMLVGKSPFRDSSKQFELNQFIKKGQFARERAAYRQLTSACQDLIESLLCTDSTKRLTVHEALSHPWLQDV